MWFTFSLLSVLAWGGADLFVKRGTDPEDKYSHHRMVILVGMAMGVHAVGYMLLTGMEYSFFSMVLYLPVSLCYILSMAIGYAGLRYIELSISSPVCNSSGAVSAILCFMFLNQTVGLAQFFGIALISIGIFMLSLLQKRVEDSRRLNDNAEISKKYTSSLIAILFPILYCVIDGIGTFLDAYYLEHFMSEAQANVSYELTFALCGIFSYIYLRFIRKKKFSILREGNFTAAALLETAGQFTYVYAMADAAILAAPMISSYSIVSVILSRIFLKEKLTRTQYAVIAMVMVGIAILGFFDA
jgi:drug/metabolite transporter (DMT)-like permease